MILGIDTSNYTASAALIDSEGNILKDERQMLQVKKGTTGLRQSEVSFRHMDILPSLLEKTIGQSIDDIEAVAVSARPRPYADSYMPCFKAGTSAGRIISFALGVPLYEFSHQEGHICAAAKGDPGRCIFCHFSGGTTEILVYDHGHVSIEGGSLDISLGQLIDRTGVLLDLAFPCGRAMDEAALNESVAKRRFRAVKCQRGYFNLSGLETQLKRSIEAGDSRLICGELFLLIKDCVASAVEQVREKTGIEEVLMGGGVSASGYLRRELPYKFAPADLAGDNAVGIALLGGSRLWQ